MQRQEIIDQLTEGYARLSPQLRLAAKAILDRPEEVALTSMRGFAAKAGVAPATMLRLARTLSFKCYEDFRESFQQALRGGEGFAGRAEWLQRLAGETASGGVVSGMARAQIGNVEEAYQANGPEALADAADCLRQADTVYVLGVAALHGVLRHFHFVLRFALARVQLVSSDNGSVIDGLLQIGPKDAVIAASVNPYGRQTVEGLSFAKQRGAKIILITDSRSAPSAAQADHLLLAPTQSPQFFPSLSATLALLESLTALVVSRGDKATVERIARLDRLRAEQGLYWQEGKRSK
ncbi:MAG: MurR/RpiR family transcriptional regulator [Limibacillus sp.]